MANSIDSCGKEDVFKMKEIMAKNNSQSIGIGLGSSNVQMHNYLLPVTHGVKIFLTLMLSLLWISAFLYRSCNHIYVQHFPVGHGISVAFMEMVKITIKPLLLSIVAIFCTWIVCYVRDIIHTHRKKIIAQPTEDVQGTDIKEANLEVENPSATEMAVPHKFRKYTSIDFRGPDDTVFNQLVIDVYKIIETEGINVEHTLVELATSLRDPSKGPNAKLDKRALAMSQRKWVKTFFECFDMKLTIKDTREDRFNEFKGVPGIPMKYLDVQDLSLFNNPDLLKRYLSDD